MVLSTTEEGKTEKHIFGMRKTWDQKSSLNWADPEAALCTGDWKVLCLYWLGREEVETSWSGHAAAAAVRTEGSEQTATMPTVWPSVYLDKWEWKRHRDFYPRDSSQKRKGGAQLAFQNFESGGSCDQLKWIENLNRQVWKHAGINPGIAELVDSRMCGGSAPLPNEKNSWEVPEIQTPYRE